MNGVELRSLMRWIAERFGRRRQLPPAGALDWLARPAYAAAAERSPAARAAAETIARHVSTHRIIHVGPDGAPAGGDLNALFSGRPAPIYTAPAWMYRLAYDLVLRGNAIAAVETDGARVRALWPVDVNSVDIVRRGGDVFVRVTSPVSFVMPYDNVLHITYRRSDDVVGSSLDAVLTDLLAAERDLIVAIGRSARLAASTRIVARLAGSLVSRKDMDAHRRYIADALSGGANGTGVAILDETVSDLTELRQSGVGIEAELLRTVQASIIAAYGISPSIATGSYTEEEYNSFYDSVVAPIVTAIASELETKLLTPRERALGHRIIIQSPPVAGTSLKTKLEIARLFSERGMMSINEARALFGLPPIDGGERVLQSLNFVDTKIAAAYQLSGGDTE
ncbi:MAG: phage portal protein [Hydrogenibacillus schlegelii]|nr:phage portal protein [Hydrogenibacillus schlegelii]